MNKIKVILLTVGLIEFIAGLSHAFMPHFILKSPGFSQLQLNEINIISCSVFSVGILLVAFGILTVIFSFKYNDFNELIILHFVLTKSVLWAARILLEIMFPTEIAMFSITRPSILLIPAFIFIDCLLILSSVLILRDMKRKSL